MRILVTGGAGYIGSHAVRLFLEQGHQVWVYDNLSTGHARAVGSAELVVGDLADGAALDELFGRVAFDAVVHFAAVASVAESTVQPVWYYRQNVAHSVNLLDTMQRHQVRRLVMSSTCAIYGDPGEAPIDEDAIPRPVNPYGRTKLAVEWLLADCASAWGLGYVALRYFNAAGAHPSGHLGEDHEPESHLIPLALRVAMGRKSHLDVCGVDYPTRDGSCVRDYIHVVDLARAHLAALEHVAPGRTLSCNLGTGRGWSVLEVVRTCEAVTGRPIRTVLRPRRPGDPPQLVAAVRRARELLHWQPRHADLESIIASAWKWHRWHPWGYGDAPATVAQPDRRAA